MTPEQIKLVNEALMGRYTEWDEIGMYFFTFLIIGVTIYFLTCLFTFSKHEDTDTNWENVKNQLTYALTIIGIMACVYGAYLVLKL